MLEMLINNLPQKKWFFVLHTMFKKKKKKLKAKRTTQLITLKQTNKHIFF